MHSKNSLLIVLLPQFYDKQLYLFVMLHQILALTNILKTVLLLPTLTFYSAFYSYTEKSCSSISISLLIMKSTTQKEKNLHTAILFRKLFYFEIKIKENQEKHHNGSYQIAYWFLLSLRLSGPLICGGKWTRFICWK